MEMVTVTSTTLSAIGNRCGHSPINPRFFEIPSSHKDRPDVIGIAQENAKNFYYQPDSWLQSLLGVRDSNRKERSEGRERDSGVLQVILHYVELASMRVGFPSSEDGGFRNLSLKSIAAKLGYQNASDHAEKGVKRVWRALNNFKKAGYIEVSKKFDTYIGDDGLIKYKGLAAVKRVTPKLFTELDVTQHRLDIQRRAARKRLNRRIAAAKKRVLEVSGKAKGALGSIINSGKVGLKRIVSGRYRNNKDAREREERKQAKCNRIKAASAQMYELIQQYPEMSAREIQRKFDIQLN